jgi:hypothetical protein
MVVYARTIDLYLCASLRCLASGVSYRSARIIGKKARTFRADKDYHSIVTTPWRTAKTRACSLDETSSLERMLVTWECTAPTPTCSHVAISLSLQPSARA